MKVKSLVALAILATLVAQPAFAQQSNSAHKNWPNPNATTLASPSPSPHWAPAYHRHYGKTGKSKKQSTS